MMRNLSWKTICLFILFTVLIVSFLLSSCGKKEAAFQEFKTLEDLRNCQFAISDGNSSYEPEIAKNLPGVSFDRYTNYFDTFIAVANGNADAAFSFKYTFIGLKESYPDLEYVESNIQIPIVANFSKDADALKQDFNAFIAEAEQSGLIDELAQKWMYEYNNLTDADVVDFSDLNGNNGSIKFALCNTNVPYEYLRNGKLTGFEPALFYEFCKDRGYKPEVTESNFDAVVAGVAAGKYDMAMSGYGYTEERDENSNFSEPYFLDKVVYTVNGTPNATDFFENIKNSFERTFIRDNRWELFVDGMLVTLLITVSSVLTGSVVGFALFLLSRRHQFLTRLSHGINNTLEALPILVVLMLFFYVIFGKTDISGVIVSIIVFGLSFAFTFFALMSNSASSVPNDQTEAGLALGYNRWQTLFKVVLPQAMESFIPSIKSAIVATLKGTAIVGYVAVQDLTKSSDLIRSLTFEAFLPIITVALLYFLMAKILIYLLNRFFITPSEKRKMMRGGK